MKPRLLLVLFALLQVGIMNAQSIVDAEYFGFEDPIDDYWRTADGTTFIDFTDDPTDSENKVLKFDSSLGDLGSTTSQVARLQTTLTASDEKGYIHLTEGNTYLISTRVFIENSATLNRFDTKVYSTKEVNNIFWDLNGVTKGEWVTLDQTFTVPVGGNYEEGKTKIRIDFKSTYGEGVIYVDDITIEAAYAVTFDIDRTAANENINITINGISKQLKTSDSPDELSFGVLNGDYTYAVLAKGAKPIYGDITVSDSDVNEAIIIEADADNTGQFTGILKDPNDAILGIGNIAITKENDIIYSFAVNSNSGRVWAGNLNTLVNKAGYIYSYTASSTGYKTRIGYINQSVDATANGTVNILLEKFNATFKITDEDGATIVGANITITNATDGNTDAEGLYSLMDLSDDGTIYDYTITADGKKEITGSIMQDDMNITFDKSIELQMEDDTPSSIETPDNSDYKVYPNPSNTVFNVVAPSGSVIELYNISGAKVRALNNTSDVTTINVSDLPKGMYLISIKNSEGKKIEKVQIN